MTGSWSLVLVFLPTAIFFLTAVPELVHVRRSGERERATGGRGAYVVKLVLETLLVGISVATLVRGWVDADSQSIKISAMQSSTLLLALLHQVATQGGLPHSSTSLLFFFLSLFLLNAYNTFFSPNTLTPESITGVVLPLAVFALELLGPDGWDREGAGGKGYSLLPTEEISNEHGSEEKKPSPILRANIFSRWFFLWHSPLLKLGLKKTLTLDDLAAMPPWLRPVDTAAALASAWDRELTRKKGPSLLLALFRAFGVPWLLLIFWAILTVIGDMAQPQLLRLLLIWVARYRDGNAEGSAGYLIACAMFGVSIFNTVAATIFNFGVNQAQLRITGPVTSLIFNKILRLAKDKGSETGTILSRVSAETDKLGMMPNLNLVVYCAVSIVLNFVSLYSILGVWALPGVAVLVAAMPLTGWIAKITSGSVKRQMDARERRTRLLGDIFASIRSIKLYAWEPVITSRLQSVRETELHEVRLRGFLLALAAGFASLAPFFVAFASLASFAAFSGRTLSSDIAFPSLALFALLRNPVKMITPLMRLMIDVQTSTARLESLLTARELREGDVERKEKAEDGVAIRVAGASFAWAEGGAAVLHDIDLVVKTGEFCAVVGMVGAGKSSLLGAMLGDISKLAGTVTVCGSIAYADQHPWMCRGSIRDNITFGHAFDEDWYDTVVDACELRHDYGIMLKGDLTLVGENGVTLSGGQQARVALARAVYSKADIFLLDDCLAALDAHVGQQILKAVLGPQGLLKKATRVLVTNSPGACAVADEIIIVKDGTIFEKRSDETVITELANLVPTMAAEKTAPESLQDHPVTETSQKKPPTPATSAPAAKTSGGDRVGAVKSDIFRVYLRWATPFGIFGLIIAVLLQQVFGVSSSVWIKNWATRNANSHGNGNLLFWLGIYFVLGLSQSITSTLVGVFGSCVVGVVSVRTAHDEAFAAVLRSPLRYFDITPVGKILNGFLNDMNRVEMQLPLQLQEALRDFTGIIAAFIVVGASAPLTLVVVPFLVVFYRSAQQQYIATSRELNRLSAEQRGPVLTSVSETAGGSSTIRAYGQKARFLQTYFAALTASQEVSFSLFATFNWLSARLQCLGATVYLASASLAVYSVVHYDFMQAGEVGLMISYALTISGSLESLVRTSAVVEMGFIAVERIHATTGLEPEAPQVIESHRPAPDWPSQGAIEFSHLSAKYYEDGARILIDVSFKVLPGEHVGVVGRTGAGKSSLMMVLFRIIEADTGTIFIDGVDTRSIGLHDLRSKLGALPQESQWFQASLRANLDPEDKASEADLWTALDGVGMSDHVRAMDGGLDALIQENGRNLSAGQRQLLCLARALLRKSKILAIDEATSSVDPESQKRVQATIKTAFTGCTLLIIAHRIDTILDCDKILVLDGGRVAEYDTPQNLLADKSSLFSGLVAQSRHPVA